MIKAIVVSSILGLVVYFGVLVLGGPLWAAALFAGLIAFIAGFYYNLNIKT